MKIRQGFVSNSSSSSFIVISKGKCIHPSWYGQDLVIFGDCGNSQFGWEFERWNDIESKINFCYIQARDVKREDWIEMLEKVLKRECSIQEIDWNLLKEDPNSWSHDAYIDHQSSSKEGRNTEMFDSEENLMNFIFNPDSYIQGGNDNV